MDWTKLETFSYGDSPQLADELLVLVLEGAFERAVKRQERGEQWVGSPLIARLKISNRTINGGSHLKLSDSQLLERGGSTVSGLNDRAQRNAFWHT